MNTQNLQTIALGAIVGTVCLLMAAVVILPAFGHPIDANTSGIVTTAFIGMAGTAAGWLAKGNVQDARTAAVFQSQRAQIAELTLKAEGK